jgi:hypothetical protein
MAAGEKCLADFGGANYLEYLVIEGAGNKRILKMG